MKNITILEVMSEIEKHLWNSKDLGSIQFVVGISRGGLIPAAFIATKLNKPLLAAYIDKQDNVYFDRTDWIQGKKVLLVDDVIRTGKTINKIRALIGLSGAKEVIQYTVFNDPKGELSMPWDIYD